VEVVTEGSAFAALRGEWDALLDESSAGIFNAWEWLYPWYRRIGTDRALRILTARDRAGRLMGLMPLGLERRRVLGRTVRRLHFLGETHVGSDYLDVVARKGLEEPVARLFAEHLRDTRAEWDVLDLTDFDSGSPTLRILQETFGAGFEHSVSKRYICPFEPIPPTEAFDAFLKRTGRRDNYLRRRKWLEKQPGYRIEKVESPEGLAPAMTDFFRLHSMRWADDGGSQGIKGPGVEAFHRDATHFLAERKQLRLYTLKLGDQALASVYGILHRGKFIYFQSGYDPEWRSKSVGLVLVGETFKDTFEGKLTEYDFLRGTEGYKSEWTTQQRQTVSVRVNAPTLQGRWLGLVEAAAKLARDVAKRALPRDTVERIRRFRRRLMAV
jgi:CelD/BcsL family acetyltransferase involved in cellulose biosynthesis